MGVYGQQLAYFPELFEDREVLLFDKPVTGGLTDRKVYRTVRSYLSRNKGGAMGVENNNRTENGLASIYVDDDEVPAGIVKQGCYVEDGGELYIFKQDNGYTLEGDFHVYQLQLVNGSTDEQKKRPHVNIGREDYH